MGWFRRHAVRSLPLAALAAGVPAEAAPFAPGETMTWEIRYLGVTAGTAWARVAREADGLWRFTGGARSADWYVRLYPVDDEIESTWQGEPPGSRRYVTRFREGRFQQDQDMDLDPAGIQVHRRQLRDGAWQEWSDAYPGPGVPVEDPQTAFYRIRQLPLAPGTSHGFKVFSGKRTWDLQVAVGPRETLETALGEVVALPLALTTGHEGDLEQKGRFTLWVTDDALRVPVRLVVHANVGSIRADIVSYAPGAGEGYVGNPPEEP